MFSYSYASASSHLYVKSLALIPNHTGNPPDGASGSTNAVTAMISGHLGIFMGCSSNYHPSCLAEEVEA